MKIRIILPNSSPELAKDRTMDRKAIADKDPEGYQKEWKKSDFSSNIFYEAFEKLGKMNNQELEYYIRPFDDVDFKSIHQTLKLYLTILLTRRRYMKVYKAYELANKVGW